MAHFAVFLYMFLFFLPGSRNMEGEASEGSRLMVSDRVATMLGKSKDGRQRSVSSAKQMKFVWGVHYWVVVSNIFYFQPYLGMIPILTNIFQRG